MALGWAQPQEASPESQVTAQVRTFEGTLSRTLLGLTHAFRQA